MTTNEALEIQDLIRSLRAKYSIALQHINSIVYHQALANFIDTANKYLSILKKYPKYFEISYLSTQNGRLYLPLVLKSLINDFNDKNISDDYVNIIHDITAYMRNEIEFAKKNIEIKPESQISVNKEIAKLNNRFNVLRDETYSIIDERLNKKIKLLAELDEKSNYTIKEISKTETQVKSLLDSMNSNKESFEELLNDSKLKIESLLGVASASNLYQKFHDRRKEHMGMAIFWAIIGSIVTYFGFKFIYANFFDKIEKYSDAENYLGVLSIFLKNSPIYIAIIFSWRQFMKERSAMEEYGFKATIALTMESIVKNIDDKEKQVQILADTVKQLYAPTQALKGNNRKKEKELSSNEALGLVEQVLKMVKGQ